MSIPFWRRWVSLVAGATCAAGILAACSREPTLEPMEAAATGETDTVSPEDGVCTPELTEIEVGILDNASPEERNPNWEALWEAMAAAVDRPVVGFYATDYAEVVERMGVGQMQVALYDGESYIEAAERSNAEAFAQPVDREGRKGRTLHLITNKDNPVVDGIDVEVGDGAQYLLENATDLSFAFEDSESISGFWVPNYYLFTQNGVEAEASFSELVYTGGDEATAVAIAQNQVDVATISSENLDRLRTTAPSTFEQIQIIWTSPIIPGQPLAYRSDLPNCLKLSIQEFFYNYDNEEILTGLQWQRLDPATDEDWNLIRELQFAKDRLDVQNDENPDK